MKLAEQPSFRNSGISVHGFLTPRRRPSKAKSRCCHDGIAWGRSDVRKKSRLGRRMPRLAQPDARIEAREAGCVDLIGVDGTSDAVRRTSLRRIPECSGPAEFPGAA